MVVGIGSHTCTTRFGGPETIKIKGHGISMSPDTPQVLSDGPTKNGNKRGREWAIFGSPPLAAEPPFAAICPRLSRYIWHKIVVEFECDNGTPRIVKHSIGGSQFPSHRLWVDGDNKMSKRQDGFARLWYGQSTFSKMVE